MKNSTKSLFSLINSPKESIMNTSYAQAQVRAASIIEALTINPVIIDDHKNGRTYSTGAIGILSDKEPSDISKYTVVLCLENTMHSMNGLNVIDGHVHLSTNAANTFHHKATFEKYEAVFAADQAGPFPMKIELVHKF